MTSLMGRALKLWTREASCIFAGLKVCYKQTQSVHEDDLLRDLREVLGFGCDCSVEFRHWDTPGCNLGPKHGCWVNDGGCANLHSTPGGAVTPLTKLLPIKNPSNVHATVPRAHCPWAAALWGGVDLLTTRQRSHTSISFSTLVRM